MAKRDLTAKQCDAVFDWAQGNSAPEAQAYYSLVEAVVGMDEAFEALEGGTWEDTLVCLHPEFEALYAAWFDAKTMAGRLCLKTMKAQRYPSRSRRLTPFREGR
jgi:hypothetical protein